MNATLPAPAHINLSHQYGCKAFMTVVTFVVFGALHRARRFWRADMSETGKIEIYTLEPFPGAAYTTVNEQCWNDSTMSEDFFRYADESHPTHLDVAAMAAISEASMGTYSVMHADQAVRMAAIELH